ncbi:hypothetical protein, partial [Escherichia coli]|uniref:hypothetical protein n=1 Tax=Escherichia coli TaxID=562 RepID=UPI000A3BAD0A
SHPVYLFLREFSLQDFRGGSLNKKESISRDNFVKKQLLLRAICHRQDCHLRVICHTERAIFHNTFSRTSMDKGLQGALKKKI